MVTGVASIVDEWALLELGFRLLQRNLERRRKRGGSRGFLGGRQSFIGCGGRRRPSGASTRRRRIGRLAALHRAACWLEVEDEDPKR
jgi:hypothetical protein